MLTRIKKDVWKDGTVLYTPQYETQWLWWKTWEYFTCEYGIIKTFTSLSSATAYINSETKISTTYLYEKED